MKTRALRQPARHVRVSAFRTVFLRAPSGGRGRSQPGRAVESLIRQAIRRGGVDAATRKACNSALPGLFAQVAGTARDLPGSGESHRVSRAVLRSIQAPNP